MLIFHMGSLRLLTTTAISTMVLGMAVPSGAIAQQSTTLDPITVEGDGEGEGIESATGSSIGADAILLEGANNLTDTLRTVPGTFTRSPSDNPGLSVNIRGMQGVGRVNTMIEGVPQTFRNMSGHAGSFDDQVFIDPSLMVGADISRGAVQGANGLGALSGSANLRLLNVDDVLREGRDTGGMLKLSAGNNGSTYNWLLSGAMRNDRASSVVALSGYEEEDYTDGGGTEVPVEVESESGLVRLNFNIGADSELSVMRLWGETDFLANTSSGYLWETDKTLTNVTYNYDPAASWIDLSVQAYLQEDDIFFPGSEDQSGASFNGRDGTDTGVGVKVTNTSDLTVAGNSLALSYGLVVQENEFEGNASSGGNASGALRKYGAFATGTYLAGAFDATAGLRLDGYEVSGVSDATPAGSGDCPANAEGGRCINDRDSRSDDAILPSLVLGYRPVDSLRVYASYGETMRAPTASEMFYPGGHAFNGGVSDATQNLDLEAETAQTYELGVQFNDTIGTDTHVHAQVTAFRSDIDNFIIYGYDTDGNASGQYHNVKGTTEMQGVELSAGVETSRYFVNLSYTTAETEQPYPLYAGIGTDIGQVPDDFGALSAGVYLLDGDLTLGGRVRYVGDSVIAIFDEANSLHLDPYTLVDLYGSYTVREGFEVFANVSNVADEFYQDAGTGVGDSEYVQNYGGRGREVTLGAAVKF